MSAAQHTPASSLTPWRIVNDIGSFSVWTRQDDTPGSRNNFVITDGIQDEQQARLIAAAPELLAELSATADLAYELMQRAQEIDRRLLEATKSPAPGVELGEITRLRQQLSRNRAAIAKAEGRTGG